METTQTDLNGKRSFIKLAPKIRITGYHAHLYYNEQTIEVARHVRLLAKEFFPDVELGQLHEQPVGPHPVWSTQIAFEPYLLPEIFPWLLVNRRGLTIFLHPETGDDLRDHTDYAVWIGEKHSLRLEKFH